MTKENSWFSSLLAKTKYLLNDYKGALGDLNRLDKVHPDNHITLRYQFLNFTKYAWFSVLFSFWVIVLIAF